MSQNLTRILTALNEANAQRSPENKARLMAVTKTVDPDKINFAVDEGVTLLGENRVQEYLSKKDSYSPEAEVHFIGHLQTNKVKYIIDSVTMIQSVDSLKLAAEINKLAFKHDKIIDILIEVNIGEEGSKSGVAEEELFALAEQISGMENLRLRGLMAIPPIGAEEALYARMEELFGRLKDKQLPNAVTDTLSMGMSGDYELALKHGSTVIRIGTGLFGARNYNAN